jgi:hypothetical protein
MRSHFYHKVSVEGLVLLMVLYGCMPKVPTEAQKNQEVLDASTGTVKPAPSDTQRGHDNDTRPGDLAERRYKVESFSLNCEDETGIDFFGSDHARIIIDSGKETLIDFENVDAGDIRTFAPGNSCILPIDSRRTWLWSEEHVWACTNTGRSGPFTFHVELRELDDLISIGGLIGRRSLEFTDAELAAAMPNVNDTFTETITLSGEDLGDLGLTLSGQYRFTYRLTRLPDRPPIIGPVP